MLFHFQRYCFCCCLQAWPGLAANHRWMVFIIALVDGPGDGVAAAADGAAAAASVVH